MGQTQATMELTAEMAVQAVNEMLTVKRQNCEPVQEDTPLESLELDSLELAELFAMLEDWSGLELDPDSARDLVTVGDLAGLRAF